MTRTVWPRKLAASVFAAGFAAARGAGGSAPADGEAGALGEQAAASATATSSEVRRARMQRIDLLLARRARSRGGERPHDWYLPRAETARSNAWSRGAGRPAAPAGTAGPRAASRGSLLDRFVQAIHDVGHPADARLQVGQPQPREALEDAAD